MTLPGTVYEELETPQAIMPRLEETNYVVKTFSPSNLVFSGQAFSNKRDARRRRSLKYWPCVEQPPPNGCLPTQAGEDGSRDESQGKETWLYEMDQIL